MNAGLYQDMLSRRQQVARTVIDDVVRGFISLPREGRQEVATRLAEHFDHLAHDDAEHWSLTRRGRAEPGPATIAPSAFFDGEDRSGEAI
jgi:hypothetical protein